MGNLETVWSSGKVTQVDTKGSRSGPEPEWEPELRTDYVAVGGFTCQNRNRESLETPFLKLQVSRSPPLKREELWTLKTRRSELRRRPGTLWHWGLHQSCCCVTMMDVVTHSLFGIYTGKRNQDSPTDLMNYPDRSEQTRTWEQL